MGIIILTCIKCHEEWLLVILVNNNFKNEIEIIFVKFITVSVVMKYQ